MATFRGMLSWQFLSDGKGTVRTKATARECCNILFKSTAMQYDRVLGAAVSLSARIEIVRSGHLSRSISL
ncbi:hypothetical protein, partial [Saccharicrinis sp. FJH54]|uniref:hypothetical protein n=1 Tax=Saccharicrinis sp. FJH54 TaxID=3344665 RepID=UPI0035D4C2C2